MSMTIQTEKNQFREKLITAKGKEIFVFIVGKKKVREEFNNFLSSASVSN
jgi:hypothetical protein